MAGFLKAVDNFHKELVNLTSDEKRQGNQKVSLTWSYVAAKIVHLLKMYPTGLTNAIILSELLTGLNDMPRFTTKSLSDTEHGYKLAVSEILESKQANISACIECYLRPLSEDRDIKTTRLAKLFDRNLVDQGFEETNLPAIEMYMHQKVCCMEEKFVSYPVRMTNLRVHNLQAKQQGGSWDFRLLPTEYVVPLLNPVCDQRFISERFLTLDGIWDEDGFPHYTRNVLVTITEIGQQETIHNAYGDSARKVDIVVNDSKSNRIKLVLWDEAVAFKNVFGTGDKLCIEEPFFVKDGDNPHLEYGPATLFYLIPANTSTEIISSQAIQTDSSKVKKISDGRLDFSSYPHRFVSMDLKGSSINITFVGTLKTVTPKVLFDDLNFNGYKFNIEVFDEFGVLEVTVFDDSGQCHKDLSPGQVLLLENIQTDGFNCCTLKTFQTGVLSNISLLRGYVASPCMYDLVNFQEHQDNGFVMLGKITKLQPTAKGFLRQAHFACLGCLEESRDKELWCRSCQSYVPEKAETFGKLETGDISRKWIWRYAVTIYVQESRSCQVIKLEVSDCACKALFHLSPEEFANTDRQLEKSVSDEIIGKTCVISVSRKEENMLFADTIEITTESFLKNFQL